MRWLFVIGVALEIGGALLISLPLLLTRSYVYPRSGPAETDMDESSYAIVGAVFLLVGFALQLAGYVDEFNHHWLILAAVGIGVALGSLLLGKFLITPLLSKWLLQKARRDDVSRR